MAKKLEPSAPQQADWNKLAGSLATLANIRRDAIFEAIATSAKELLRSSDLNVSLPIVVERVGQAAGADRLHILLPNGDAKSAGGVVVSHHYVWSAPGISSPPDFLAIGKSLADVGLDSWVPRLASGKSIVGHTRNFDPAARRFMESGGVKSVLAVPIFVEGEWCGIIGFDDCRCERDWLPAEIDIVKILAELVGAAIISLRRLRGLADADRIIEKSPTIVYRLGPQEPFPLLFLSNNVGRYGYDVDALLAAPNRWSDLLDGADLAVVIAALRELAAGTRDYARLEFRFKRPDGSPIWFDGSTTPLRDDAGRLIALEGIMTDITARKRVEQELASSHVLLSAAMENSPDGILVVDQNDRVTACNRHFMELWKVPPELISARTDEPVLRLVASAMKNEREFLARVRALYAQPEMGGHDELETKDGRTIDRHSEPLYDADKHHLGRIWFFRDITERKAAERKIVEFARTDSLTGLPNRVAFLDRFESGVRPRQTRRPSVRGALSRSRSLQGRQRHVGASGRRHAPEGRGRSAQRLRA